MAFSKVSLTKKLLIRRHGHLCQGVVHSDIVLEGLWQQSWTLMGLEVEQGICPESGKLSIKGK